jgi:hypothetical protein
MPSADLADQRRRSPVENKAHALGRSPLREQGDRVGAVGIHPAGIAIFVGQRHRGHPVDGLAGDTQRLTAGRQHTDLGAVAQDGVCDLRAGTDEVLAVVEHDQSLLGRQARNQDFERRLT